MKITFEQLNSFHKTDIIKILNDYIREGTSAFPQSEVQEDFFELLMKISEGYPAYALVDAEVNQTIGFCMLRPYNSLPTFRSAAAITYFIQDNYTNKGIGCLCLKNLEDEAQKMEISDLVAEISSENQPSINFHKKNGFALVGELKDIGKKLNRSFGVTIMQKKLTTQ